MEPTPATSISVADQMGLELSAQMTQILTCVTPTLIVQVSDRRLT
jgi:hypothetical protein